MSKINLEVYFRLINKCISPKIVTKISGWSPSEHMAFDRLLSAGLIRFSHWGRVQNDQLCAFYVASDKAVEMLRNWDMCLSLLGRCR